MNILELDSFNLGDAIKFHDRLNHRLWDNSEHLHPQVKEKLLEVVKDFQEFLGVDDLQVKDITISGSNAAYSYTDKSDIDLHLVVDIPDTKYDDVFRELFDAKKYQYNDQHNIKIGGSDVELYVQPGDEEHHSQGVYSLLRNIWLSVPKRRRAEINDSAVRDKVQDLAARIDSAVSSGNFEHIANLQRKIKTMRQTGLEQNGEFGTDNIAFKLLRNQGYIKKLIDARNAARDQQLSLAEKNKQKEPVIYGFVTESPDGVNPSTKMFLEDEPSTEHIIDEFIYDTARYLGIEDLPEIVLHNDPAWSEQNRSFGMYQPDSHTLQVNLANRHLLDIMRTTAHELAHCRQHEIKKLGPNAGETGSKIENEAHAVAGIVMRNFADAHPEYFKEKAIAESSGYIPTEAEKNDPRFEMALSVDVRPGATGLNANRMRLKTDAQGKPQMLRADGRVNMAEARLPQPSQGPGKYRDLNEPLGPETPPTMPSGTVKVDVSDVYDWYKLGQHISNMKGLGKHDFGAGPPSAILSFGDEETEHKYIKDLEKTGLTTTDIDPLDPKQPKGMKRQKTDPTYNVGENALAESLLQELELFEEQDLFEINMGSKSLRKEAAKTGAIAGMEFEMIVPNIENDDDDDELEPDYDQDERCRSIDDAVAFFHDGDYNGRREVEQLRDRMYLDYTEWLDDKLYQDWERGGEEYLQEWVPNNVDESEWNPNSLEGEARTKALEEFIASMHADPGSSDAFDEFREENQDSYDESDWLDAEDLDRMSGIENAYEISWPHWTSSGGGEASIQDVASDFENAIDRDVRASGNYHSGSVQRPSPTSQHYIVEPDGSLEPDNSGDTGLEFVSPPLPIDEILNDLNKVKAWAKEYGCYTNDSTGLHINISVPDYSRENLDFVKLALLMGDEYVLDLFGRAGNTYAKSAMKMVKEKVRSNPDAAKQLLDKMKNNLDALATKAIHSGITSKYTSINTKDGHIEFRSPGGDWLDENFDKIENTLLRFTVAMSAALNPESYRQEYQKKLYKLLTEDNKDTDTIKYFAQYAAGELPKAALRSFVKQAQLERRIQRGEGGDQKMWWSVGRPGYFASVNVVASSKEEAIAKGKAEYPDWASAQDMTAKPLRPYEDTTVPTLNGRPSNPDGNWFLRNTDTDEIIYRFNAVNYQDAYTVLQQWKDAHPGSENIGYGKVMGSGQGDQPPPRDTSQFGAARGAPNWEIRRNSDQEVVHRFSADNQNAAMIQATDFMNTQGWSNDDYTIQAADSQTDVNPLRPTGPGPWEVANRNNNQVYYNPEFTNRGAAESEARTWLSQNGYNPNEFEVRTRQGVSQTTDQRQGGIIDIEPDISSYVTPGSTTDLAQQRAAGGFTGTWKVMNVDTGQELYRFSGVGNVQSDANGVALEWIRRNAPYTDLVQIEVVPVMGNA